MEDSKVIVDASELTFEEPELVEVPKEPIVEPIVEEEPVRRKGGKLINCLRNERVKVQFVPSSNSDITDKTHPYWGGMSDNAWHAYTVPLLRNGTYKNPLTDSEKAFLEDYMGLEPNALSVHKRSGENFWENRQVFVTKDGEVLDLSTPMGYINWKILLTNSDEICPSLKDLRDRPKATYRFVLVSDSEVYNSTVESVSVKTACWKAYGKYEEDFDTLKTIIETVTGLSVDRKSNIAFLQGKAVELIDSHPNQFLAAAADKYLSFKVLIAKAVERGVIERRADYYYYMNTPLCNKNENPTITVAARYISEPKNQEILFSIQSKLK